MLRPIYQKTAAYGHFGRADSDFTWERTDKKDALRSAARKLVAVGASNGHSNGKAEKPAKASRRRAPTEDALG